MQPIIYDVAVSTDGFIAGPGGDISQFAFDGPVVEDYQARLANYTTAIMGRSTYEFGYGFGMQPGQNPYPNMQTIVFSDTLEVPENSDVTAAKTVDECHINRLKQEAKGPIYLCGGGAFAGSLLRLGMIDRLVLKRAPCIYGGGVKLFGDFAAPIRLTREHTKTYSNGYVLDEFAVEVSDN